MKELKLTSTFLIYDYNELTADDKALVDAAKQATRTSYAPYSHFQVGAAVRLDDGTVVCGSNQENAAYPSGLCAERTAVFSANAQHPDHPVVALAIAAFNQGAFLQAPIPPCGACRQVLLEVEERYRHPIRILLYGEEGTYVTESVRELLPLQFVSATMA